MVDKKTKLAIAKLQGNYCVVHKVRIIGAPYSTDGELETNFYMNRIGEVIQLYHREGLHMLPLDEFLKVDFGKNLVRWFPKDSVTWG